MQLFLAASPTVNMGEIADGLRGTNISYIKGAIFVRSIHGSLWQIGGWGPITAILINGRSSKRRLKQLGWPSIVSSLTRSNDYERELGSRHRLRDARAALDRLEDFLGGINRVRRGA